MKKNRLWVISLLAVVSLLMASLGTVAFASEVHEHEKGNYTPIDAERHSFSCTKCGGDCGTEPHTFVGTTCEKKCAYCGYTVYEHTYEKKTVKATCTEGGYTKYTCTKCGDSYKKNKTEKLYHWFGEWTPNGNDSHSATCKREGCGQSTNIGCETFGYTLNGVSCTLCPVCGENADGTRLELVEAATATSEKLPEGELVLRKNDEIMSVGFEYAGRLTQPTKPVTVTLPAADVEGYTLSVLNADGTETALETTVDGENAGFTLDFGEAKVVLIHMTAAA